MREPYHTALSAGQIEATAPAQRFEHDGNVAFAHDLTLGFPAEFDDCDVLYTDLPWRDGFGAFNDRAGKPDASFRRFMETVAMIPLMAAVPVVIITGKRDGALLPKPRQVFPIKLNGGDAQALVYNTTLIPNGDTIALLHQLAVRFERVGDFCCGYGRAGRIFQQHGKGWVMSDINPNCIGLIAEQAPGW